MGTKDGQLYGREFSNYHENIAVLDFLTDVGGEDSNTSNKSFIFEKSYEKEFEREQQCNK